jgi:RNA polymerase sigma factor for flagellar operon FliA
MFDGLKPMDPLPREVRRAVHKVHDAQRQYRVANGREPLPEELAEVSGTDREACIRYLRAARDTTPVSLFEANGGGDENRPLDQLVDDQSPTAIDVAQREDLKKLLLREFTRGERLVLTLYYYEELTMQEIGEALGVTATRVCQIHGDIIKRLRERLGSRHAAEELLAM